MRAWGGSVKLAALVMLLGGCVTGGSPGGDTGECAARIGLGGHVYRAVAVVRMPRAGQSLGAAGYRDCDGSRAPGLGKTQLWAVPNLDRDAVVLAREQNSDAVYVNQEIAPRDWPELLKVATRFPSCEGAATFTGSWDLVDPASMPNMEDYDIAVPYTATLNAKRGQGLHLDQWSSVSLQARFTANTDPQPSPTFVKRALADNQPVAVTTECRGSHFEVTTIRFSN